MYADGMMTVVLKRYEEWLLYADGMMTVVLKRYEEAFYSLRSSMKLTKITGGYVMNFVNIL